MSLDKYITISRFLKADKPEWVLPIDVLLVIRLITLDDAQLEAKVSHATLAAEFSSSDRTIRESLYRLKDHGWVVAVSGKRAGRANTYAVQVEALPLSADLKRTIISAEAVELAKRVYRCIHKLEPKKKVFRGWQQRFGIAIQRRLDSGYTEDRLVGILNFAFRTPEFKEKAMKGPQALRRVWPRLEALHDASKAPPKIDWEEIARKAEQQKAEAGQ